MVWWATVAIAGLVLTGTVAAQDDSSPEPIDTEIDDDVIRDQETVQDTLDLDPNLDLDQDLDNVPAFEAIPGIVPPSPGQAARVGGLRVGNRTPYPIRVVLLQRRVSQPVPAHWDFAPGEGGSEGLLLSIQEREPLQLNPGDVIVAFALDGSRRYWGPNVVDETLAPFWDADLNLWTMIIQP